nr:TonB-dependent receptor [Chitinophagales bacterium]
LYGPFASQGVLAMYTKSPLDMDNRMEVTLGLTTGMRAQDNDQPAFGFKADNSIEKLGILSPEIRIAAKLSKQIGVKVSANYMSATDFAYFDNREPNQGTSIRFGDQSGGSAWRQRGSETGVFNRDFSIKKISTDARLDFRPADNIELIFNGGYANNTNMELTGLGAAQARDWTSTYFQTRLKVGKLFLQYFLNQTNSGSTFLIPQSTTQRDFSYLGEQSSLQSIQGQHSTDLINNKLNLVYGVDIFLTRPRGNVYGRFDNGGANINQYGAYAQGKYQFNKQWSFTGALRADYQDVIDEWMFSPRAALMYKPEENQTFRLTYNRAFQAPGALNFFLDLNNARFPNGGNARGFGNGTGFTYGTTALGQGPFAGQNNTLINLPSQGQQLPLTGITTNPTFIGFSRAYTAQAMIGSLANGGVPAALAGSIVTKTLAGLAPTQMAFTDITTGKNVNLANVKDREAVKSTVNQTFEAGYKGQIGEKLTLGLDLYYTRIENFVSPLTAASYALTFDESFFNNPATAGQIATNLSTLSAQESAILKTALLGNASATTSETVAAVLRNYYTLNNASSPAIFGPQGTGYERDILLTYFNLGTIDYAGADFQANYQATDDLNIDFAYSHINKDRIITNEVPEGYIALNAPKHKTAMTLSYNLPIDNKSVALNAGWRWMDKFIANSAVYKGFVNAANLFDLGLTWRPSSSQGTIIGLNAINLLDHRHQFFPGTPEMGRVVMLKLQHTFGVK